VVAEASRAHPFLRDTPPEIEWHGFQADGYVLEGGEVPEAALRAAHEAAIGAPGPDDEIWTALTDTRFYGLYHGIPALCYGPKAESIHGFDERVDLDSVQRCTEVIALFVAQWCGLRAL